MNSGESLKDFLRKVDVESFAERVISVIHWLLLQSVKCKLRADASFANASWRRALKDTSSCTLRYVVYKPNTTTETYGVMEPSYRSIDADNIIVTIALLDTHGKMVGNSWQSVHVRQQVNETDDALASRLNDTIVNGCKALINGYESPLVRALSHAQISTQLLDYLADARTLCRLASTCQVANYVCSRDTLWHKLLARDFGTLALAHALRPYKESYALLYRQQKEVERRMAEAPSTNRYVDPLRETVPLYVGDSFGQPSQPHIPGIIQDPDPFEPFRPRMPGIFPNRPQGDPTQPDDPLRIGPPRRSHIIGDPRMPGQLPRRGGGGGGRFPDPDVAGGSDFGGYFSGPFI